tara:strand:+ start:75 stop:2399 length:2325 start_codon:yes stop_codon:yes gene_type:complete
MGTLIEQSIKTLYQGVSRQPDSVRLPGQVEEATNVLMSVVTGGFESRPSTRHIAQNTFITAVTDKPFVYSYARDAVEKYVIVVKGSDLKVFDLDGVEKTVTYPNGKAYLAATDPSASFSAVTIADRTVIANNQFTVAMANNTYVESPTQALINCRTTNNATSYSISINGSSVWTYSGGAQSATEIATDIMSNISLPTGFTATRDDLTITIEDPADSDFTIEHEGSDDIYGPLAMRQNVAKRTHLPPSAPNNYKIRVGATIDGNELGYWAKFSTDDGGWVETADPYAKNDFDLTTMPHFLTRQADGTFIFDRGTYDGRLSGDTTTAPDPDFVGQKIQSVVYHRNRLGIVAGETVYFSQSGKYFTYWADFSTQSLDSDGFGLTASASEVNLLKHALSFRKALFLTSDKNQFEVSGEDQLTPETATVDLSTTYLTEILCKPMNLGSTLYFAAKSGRDACIYEYKYDDNTLSNTASDITLHALGYVPAPIIQMTGDPTNDMLFLLSEKDRSRIFIYKMYIDGEKKAQSAWHVWDLGGTDVHIHWCKVVEGDLYLMVTRGTQTFLEEIKLRYELSDDKHPYQICLDQQTPLTGSFNSTTDKTTWTTPYLHNSKAAVVLSTDFAAGKVGERLTVTYPTTTTIEADGDQSAGQSIVGIPFDQEVQLSKLFARETTDTSRTITTGRFQLSRIQINFQETGFFNLKVTPAFRDEQVFTFNGRRVGSGDNLVGTVAIAGNGSFPVPIQTEASTAIIKITNSTEKPMTITSIDYRGFFNELTRAE